MFRFLFTSAVLSGGTSVPIVINGDARLPFTTWYVLDHAIHRGRFDHHSDEAGSVRSRNVVHSSITANDIFDQIRARIVEKNRLAQTYRAKLPAGSQVSLLLWSAVTVSRGLPIPHGLEHLAVPFEFE